MRPRARLISLIGEELISDESVAVVELVKNAYDADATQVSVSFGEHSPNSPGSLLIQDDGRGMTLDTVLHGWLEPGTVMKKHTERSPRGRVYQGAKGVGRFAAARLAENLLMETHPVGEPDSVIVLLEWGKFDDESYLDEVLLEYEQSVLVEPWHGTRLTLESLRRVWTEDDYKKLHDRLSRLISPFEEDHSDFRIHLDIPDHPELTGQVEPHEITRKPRYQLLGVLDESGKFSGVIQYFDGKTLTEMKSYQAHQFEANGKLPACGPLEVEIRTWDRDRAGLTQYMLMYDRSLTDVRKLLDTYCGVSLYRDGFRVHPYGEKGNDWLNLDYRSRLVPTLRLANNQIVAAIRISREMNGELKDRTTREGLVHNEAYEGLRDWFKEILMLLESARYDVRPREEKKAEPIEGLFEPFDLSDVVREANSTLGREHPITKMVGAKDVEVREGVKRLQEFYSRLLMTAGLGQLVDVVIHEIGAPASRLNRELRSLEKLLKDELPPDKIVKFSTILESCRSYVEQIILHRKRLDPKSAAGRLRSTTFDVREEIEANISLFSNLLSKQAIRVATSFPPEPVAAHMPRSAVGQIVANLLDNSIYWVTRHHGDGRGGQILIRLLIQDRGFQLILCDDGPGIMEHDREHIFDPYFTTKSNGMGLGLYIARQVIDPFGKLILGNDCALAGACFEASFERNVGL